WTRVVLRFLGDNSCAHYREDENGNSRVSDVHKHSPVSGFYLADAVGTGLSGHHSRLGRCARRDDSEEHPRGDHERKAGLKAYDWATPKAGLKACTTTGQHQRQA